VSVIHLERAAEQVAAHGALEPLEKVWKKVLGP
jgi:hypothetical protein